MILSQTFLQTLILSLKTTLKTLSIKLYNIKQFLKQNASGILQNGNVLGIKIDSHFYNYVLDIIGNEALDLNKLHQRKHINIFP